MNKLLLNDLQDLHGASLDTDTAGDALGSRILRLENHNLHGANLDTLAAAITQNPKTGVYMINKKKCVSCGKCVEVCPMKVMVKKDGAPVSKCIACGICVKACPMEILEIVEK